MVILVFIGLQTICPLVTRKPTLALVLPPTMVVVITVFTLYGGGLSPPNSAEPLNCFQLAPFI